MAAGLHWWEWLVLAERELLLFASAFFLIAAVDELAVDLTWLWLKLTGKAKTPVVATSDKSIPAELRPVIFIPAWQEQGVIGETVRHTLAVWRHPGVRLYVGVYHNDPETMACVLEASGNDPRLRLVVHEDAGPSTKADCLNRLYRALELDEGRCGRKADMVILQDAEDMVDPAALPVMATAMRDADLVQLPVLPQRHPASRWVSGHYLDEFAEAHGKTMVVREAVGAGMPLAGVGCAIARQALAQLATQRATQGPFASDSVTEDYEMGLGLSAAGARTRFVRLRDEDGRLIATRSFFPATLTTAIRQKTRWIQGISLQGWDRVGWGGGPGEYWMRIRDRRGPFAALVLAVAYVSLVLFGVNWALRQVGIAQAVPLDPLLATMLTLNLVALGWRMLWRVGFTAREYGLAEGVMSILRVPVANLIAIIAGRRAFFAYLASLSGRGVVWDKTRHDLHPATPINARAPA